LSPGQDRGQTASNEHAQIVSVSRWVVIVDRRAFERPRRSTGNIGDKNGTTRLIS